jgi:hypothetical protein
MSASASALAWIPAVKVVSAEKYIEPRGRQVHDHACGAMHVCLMRIGALGPVHAGRDNYRRRGWESGIDPGGGLGWVGVKRSEMGRLMLI